MFLKSLREVYRIHSSWLITIDIFLVLICLGAWLPNWRLMITFLFSSTSNISQKIYFLITALLVYTTNYTIFSALATLLIFFLAAIEITLLQYAFRRQQRILGRAGGTGIVAFLISMLGFGCTSCGSLVISTLAVSGALSFLPFGGAELMSVALVLLIISLIMTTRQIGQKLWHCYTE